MIIRNQNHQNKTTHLECQGSWFILFSNVDMLD